METDSLTKILIVEDDVNDRLLLTHQLAVAQIDDLVTVVTDGREALEFLLRIDTPPIATFLDLRLPGLSGIDLLRRVRQDARLLAMPVIVMTSSRDPNDLHECNRLGITAYLQKPVKLTTFIKTVAHLFPEKAPPEQPFGS